MAQGDLGTQRGLSCPGREPQLGEGTVWKVLGLAAFRLTQSLIIFTVDFYLRPTFVETWQYKKKIEDKREAVEREVRLS